MSNRFFYFSFGSNLLQERIHIRNPTAEYVTVGRVDGYRLDFDYLSGRWHGAVASITKSPSDHVWGVVWTLDAKNLPDLDEQEGVGAGIYEPLEIDVKTKEGEVIRCRTYQLLARGYKDKRPSPQYMDVIIRGALEHELPEYYVDNLKKIEHNGYDGRVDILDNIVPKKT